MVLLGFFQAYINRLKTGSSLEQINSDLEDKLLLALAPSSHKVE